LATEPKLLLADESLGGITIVLVEHIMGVLMRIVDCVIVLDHGEKIFEGEPAAAVNNERVIEVYLGRGHH
jgi:branched-chain amino acid transport system ATP-binding protein